MAKAVSAVLGAGAVALVGAIIWSQSSAPPGTAAAVGKPPVWATASIGSIAPASYKGPASCRECHAKVFADWEGHPHRRMNQDASRETVRGDFSGVRIEYSGGTVLFATENGLYTMTLDKGPIHRKYRITRSVGSRFMQFYIGIQLEGPEPRNSAAYVEETKLGFGYWFKLARWLPVSYFDPVGPETNPDGTPAFDPFERPRVHVWRQNCMLCHNTVPWVFRLALPDSLEGFPELEHQVAPKPLLAEIGRSIDLAPHPGSQQNVKERIQPGNLVTLGISCEACHFGCKEHAETNGDAPTSYLPSSPFVRWVDRKTRKPVVDSNVHDARVMNGVCAQCHCATVTHFPNGSGTWNSREATDMIGGACASKIRCVDCHDPHRNDGAEGLVTSATHVAACLKCHETKKKPEAMAAHSRHSSEVTCLDCHMPRLTQGLEEVVRTHRISSPTEVSMLENGSGNACNLCHLGKPITWTLEKIKEQYGRDIAPTASWSVFYGDGLSKPVGRVWLEGHDPSMRLVATQAYARSPLGKDALPELIRALDDPVAVNRVFDMFAISRIRGRELSVGEIDVTASTATRKKQIEKLLRRD